MQKCCRPAASRCWSTREKKIPETRITHSGSPDCIGNAFTELPCFRGNILSLMNSVQHICQVCQFDRKHRICWGEECIDANIIGGTMMRPDHSSKCLWFAISLIWHRRAQSTVASRPIVEGDDIKVGIKLKEDVFDQPCECREREKKTKTVGCDCSSMTLNIWSIALFPTPR